MGQLKIKHDDTANPKSLRIQCWNGNLPTYDSEAQRAKALAGFGGDVGGEAEQKPAVEPTDEQKKANEAQAAAAWDKTLKGMNKPDLTAHAESLGITVTDEDTKATIFDKIKEKETAPPADFVKDHEAKQAEGAKDAEEKTAKPAEPELSAFKFSRENCVQEQTLRPGEEKVFSVTAGMFITIKEDI